MDIFSGKNRHFRNFGPRKFFPSPKTRRQVSAAGNYKVLVNLAKDSICSHFSGNEYAYCKELFHFHKYHYKRTRSQGRDLTHRKPTVGLRCTLSSKVWNFSTHLPPHYCGAITLNFFIPHSVCRINSYCTIVCRGARR